MQDGKSLRAHGALWPLSTVAVTDGRLIDTTALRAAFEVPGDLTNPAYGGDAAKLHSTTISLPAACRSRDGASTKGRPLPAHTGL